MATILIETDDGELPSSSAVLQVRATNRNTTNRRYGWTKPAPAVAQLR